MTDWWIISREQEVTVKTGPSFWDRHTGVLLDSNNGPLLTHRGGAKNKMGEVNPFMWRFMDAVGKKRAIWMMRSVLALFCLLFPWLARHTPHWPFSVGERIVVYPYHWVLWTIYVAFFVGHCYGIASFRGQYVWITTELFANLPVFF